MCEIHSQAATVVPTAISCSLPPPVRMAVTVMEYSVPSSRSSSLYIHCLTTSNGRGGVRARDTISISGRVGDGV